MDMAPMALKKLFTSFEKATNPATARHYSMFHDMPLKTEVFDLNQL